MEYLKWKVSMCLPNIQGTSGLALYSFRLLCKTTDRNLVLSVVLSNVCYHSGFSCSVLIALKVMA